MDLHLTSNHDGTSSGFIVTKHEILMVVNDRTLSFEKNFVDSGAIDIFLQGALDGDSFESISKNIANSLLRINDKCIK